MRRAAPVWRGVLAYELAIAIGVAWAVGTLAPLPAAALVLAGFAAFVLLQLLLVAASAAAGRALSGAASGTGFTLGTARAIARETLHFACMKFVMSAQSGATARAENDAAGDQSPVLLVHGLACNRGVWWMVRRRLRAAGFRCVHVIDLEPLDADLDALADSLHDAVGRLRKIHPAGRLTIVAHSMGGLIARAMTRSPGAGPVHHLITLATPHGGAALARLLAWPCARQMRPGSDWLARLDARRAAAASDEPRTTCFYSADDNLVVPAHSATLPGARNLELAGHGHFSLLVSRRVGNLLIDALREAA